MSKRYQLCQAATALLRKAGCDANGRKRGEVCPAQRQFERRIIRTPVGGQPTGGKLAGSCQKPALHLSL